MIMTNIYCLLIVLIIILIYFSGNKIIELGSILIYLVLFIELNKTMSNSKQVLGSHELLEYPFKYKSEPNIDIPIKLKDWVKNNKIEITKKYCNPDFARFQSNIQLDSIGIIYIPEETYNLCDKYSDYFYGVEKARLSAKLIYAKMSPLEQWENPYFQQKMINKYGTDPGILREGLYNDRETMPEATQFKISLSYIIYKKYNAKKVLDISSGWGDRLTGAILADVEKYNGYDPNLDLVDSYTDIIKKFNVNANNFNVTPIPFEKAEIKEKYDLVFTSPPFFDFEIYNKKGEQSIINYPTFDDWFVKFLCVSLKKAWDALIDNGHMIIYIMDIKNYAICEPMSLFMLYLGSSDIQYLCSFAGAGKYRPFWIFQKTGNIKKENKLLEKFYPNLYKKIIEEKLID